MNETPFEMVGGNLALDFANTVSTYLQEPAGEKLTSYDELLRWARQAELCDDVELRRLRREAARRPADAERALAAARALREAIYWICAAALRGERPAAVPLAALNRALAAALAHQRVVAGRDGLALGWEKSDELDAPLWPIARAAAALVTSPDLARVRMCHAAEQLTCTWLFVDDSRNHSRRWCSMRDCGNREKARRHYRKQLEAS